MSYRHRIYKVPKAFVEEARACPTMNEFKEVYKKYLTDPQVHFDWLKEENHYPLYHLGKQLFDFGDGYGNAEEMYKHGDSLFNSDELNKAYYDYLPIVLDEDALLCAIEFSRNLVVDTLRDLLREESTNVWEKKKSQLDRLIQYIKLELDDWDNEYCPDLRPYNLNKEFEEVVDSWMYKYTTFELVRIYKTFDFENYAMLFYGW